MASRCYRLRLHPPSRDSWEFPQTAIKGEDGTLEWLPVLWVNPLRGSRIVASFRSRAAAMRAFKASPKLVVEDLDRVWVEELGS